MITPNTDSTFIRVKSASSEMFTWQNGKVADVIEMTTQHFVEKSVEPAGAKCEDEICKSTRRLDDLLLIAVDETMKQVFKEAGAEVIYNFIENKCHLKREEIAARPIDFSAGLESLLGSAAPVIEKLILENLYSKFQLKFEEKDSYGFSTT